MKFLIDNAQSQQISARLCQAGHDAIHVRELGMQSASDLPNMAQPLEEGSIIILEDARIRVRALPIYYREHIPDL